MIKNITICILVGTAIVLALWDVFAAAQPVSGDTISEVIWAVSAKHPIIPMAIGVICGHLFWQK